MRKRTHDEALNSVVGPVWHLVAPLCILAILVCGFCLKLVTSHWRAEHLPDIATKSERDEYAAHVKGKAAARYFINAAGTRHP